MNRRRLAGLVAMSRSGTGYEAAIATSRLQDLLARRKVTKDEIEAIAEASTVGAAAPPVAVNEPWRSEIAAAIAIVHGCKAHWRRGEATFVGADARDALSDYLRVVAECDLWQEGSYEREVDRIFAASSGASRAMGALFGVEEAPEEVPPEARLVWKEMFRNAFAKAVWRQVAGPPEKGAIVRASPEGAAAAPSEIVHAEDLKMKVGGFHLAVLVQRAEQLGAAAGSRVELRMRRRLMARTMCGRKRVVARARVYAIASHSRL